MQPQLPRVKFYPIVPIPEHDAVVAFTQKKVAERDLTKAILEAHTVRKITGDCRQYVPPHNYGPIEPPVVTSDMSRKHTYTSHEPEPKADAPKRVRKPNPDAGFCVNCGDIKSSEKGDYCKKYECVLVRMREKRRATRLGQMNSCVNCGAKCRNQYCPAQDCQGERKRLYRERRRRALAKGKAA